MPIVEGKYVNPQFQNLGPPALSAGNLNDLADTVEALDAVGAQANVIETIEVNGSALTPENKTVDITVPTATSELDNDSDFQTGNEVGQTVQSALSPIEAKIPVAASASNQLADKNYVAQQISTNAAFFRGSFPTKAALMAVQWQTADPNAPNYVTNNDYAVVEDDESHDDECWRYIYVSGTGWQAQYRINESPLTSDNGVVITDGTNVGLTDKFYNYLVRETFEKPTIAAFAVTGLGGAAEIGTSVEVSAFTHRETNIDNFDGTLTLKKGNDVLAANIAPSNADASGSFTNQTVASNTAATVTFTLSGTYTMPGANAQSESVSRSVSKTFYVPRIYGVSENSTVEATDLEGMTRVQSYPSPTTVQVLANGYIFLAVTGTITKVINADTGFGVAVTQLADMTLSINGVSKNYHVYRTDELTPQTLKLAITVS